MSSPTVFGATIISSNKESSNDAKANEDVSRPRPAYTPAASQYSLDLTETEQLVPPRSPFYQHPPASNERVSKSTFGGKNLDVGITEKSLNGSAPLTPMTTKSVDPFSSSISVCANKECSMWPSRQTLVQNNMAEKRKKRSTTCLACAGPRHYWANLHNKQKLIISIALAVLIIGGMIGIGVGISKTVHGTYYSPGGSKST